MIIETFLFLVAASKEPVEPDGPAEPIVRPTIAYPVSCAPKPGETRPPGKVIIVYTVTTEGMVENARIRESSDPCFNDAALAATREWKFKPRRKNGFTAPQEDVETTFTFNYEQATDVKDFDAAPISRAPPVYPVGCMRRAASRETVLVAFDVNERGETENAHVIDSTNRCLNKSALAAVEKWKYRPKIVDGKPVPRKGAQTLIAYELDGSGSTPWRRQVLYGVKNAGMRLRRGDDPKEVLADLDAIEKKYGATFSRNESAGFHQIRGAARLQAKDYHGALDDFRIAQRQGVDASAQEAVSNTIVQLEAIVAAEDAAAAKAGAPEAGGLADDTPNSGESDAN